MQEEMSQWAKEKHTDRPNHSKSFNGRAGSHIRGLTSRSAKSTGKELPGFRLATLRQLLPGLGRDDCTHLAGAKGAFLPQPPRVQLLQAALSPAASQPRPGASLAARSQLSLLWGAPSYRVHRGHQGKGRRRGPPGARGAVGPRGWRGAGAAGARRARAGRDAPAAQAVGAVPPRPRTAPPGFPQVSARTPGRPWSSKPAREEKET